MLNVYKQCVQVILKRGYNRHYVPLMKALKKRKEREVEVLRRRSAFINWNYSAELFAFAKRLNEPLSEKTLQTALTHTSYIEQEEKHLGGLGIENASLNLEDNKELIKLGELSMENYILKYLRHSYPHLPEEGIRCVYEFLITDSLLSHIAKNLGLTELILSADFPVEDKTLASTLKALVGAISTDRNTEAAQNFILDFILTHLSGKDIHDLWEIPNPIAMLKDILQKSGKCELEPRLLRETGRNTIFAVYLVGIYFDKELIGQGPGETLEIAQEMASLDALRRIFKTTECATPFAFGKEGKQLNSTCSLSEQKKMKSSS